MIFHHCLICTVLTYISFKQTFFYLYFVISLFVRVCTFFIGMLNVFLIRKSSLYSKDNLLSIICGKYFPL